MFMFFVVVVPKIIWNNPTMVPSTIVLAMLSCSTQKPLPGVWSSRELKGERPPPCDSFTFTKLDQHRAVLFGGRQPNHRVNDVYVFDFRNMVS